MAIQVLVPRLGEGVDELAIVKWLKKEGDPVRELEPLLEVETDKVVTEIPSPAAGVVLKIAVPENTPATVGTVIAWIGQPGERVPKSSAPVSSDSVQSVPEASVASANETPGGQGARDTGTRDMGYLSPIVRKLAAQGNVDLSQVRGTGLNGRITKQDVLAYLEKHVPVPVATISRDTGARGTGSRDTLLPITTIRRQIAERMQHSKRTSPHVLTVMEADLGRVTAHRQANRAAFETDGVRLTYTAYFIAALASALRAHPRVNSSWTEQGLQLHAEVNIGMAASLGEEGLIVPVLRRADELSLLGIARAVNDLSGRARARQLRPEEVRGGTFTLTNHGTGGSLFAMPIINQPQCGILGVGALQKRPAVVVDAAGNDAIAIRPMVYLSLVFDHRILDGAGADAFLLAVKDGLEKWGPG